MTSASGARSRQLPLAILLAMGLGVLVAPHAGAAALVLGELGNVTIQLIKGIATPLLFLAIVRALATTEVHGRWVGRLLAVAVFNVAVAILIGLTASNLFAPGRGVSLHAPSGADYAATRFDPVATLVALVPRDVITPFSQNLVLSVVVLAVLTGLAMRKVLRDEALTSQARAFVSSIEAAYAVAAQVLTWVLALVPVAVFGVVTKTVATHGMGALAALLPYVLVGLGGLVVHVLVTYQAWLVLYARLSLRRFWAAARLPISVAWGSNSSLATLPATLEALGKLGVSREASAVGACVGTNLNNDGIVLYEGMAVLWVAQALGIQLDLVQQLLVAVTCVIAAMGVAGVPEAGFVSLALVLNAVGISTELLPVLLTVDWIVARGRSVVNVLSDMVLSIVLDRMEGRQFRLPPTG